MTSWSCSGTTVAGELGEGRAEWLRDELTRYRDYVDQAESGASFDPALRAALGLSDNLPDRPVLNRIRFSVDVVLASLPTCGDRVVLRTSADRWAWIMAARDLGLVVMLRNGTDLPESVRWLWQVIDELVHVEDAYPGDRSAA